jgi:hypothetical protein
MSFSSLCRRASSSSISLSAFISSRRRSVRMLSHRLPALKRGCDGAGDRNMDSSASPQSLHLEQHETRWLQPSGGAAGKLRRRCRDAAPLPWGSALPHGAPGDGRRLATISAEISCTRGRRASDPAEPGCPLFFRDDRVGSRHDTSSQAPCAASIPTETKEGVLRGAHWR